MTAAGDNQQSFPPWSVSDALSISFSSWYPLFKDNTFKSVVVKPLSERFVEYLTADGIALPKDLYPLRSVDCIPIQMVDRPPLCSHISYRASALSAWDSDLEEQDSEVFLHHLRAP